MKVKRLTEASGKYYVTTYTETSYSGPEEGGYTSYGWEAQSSKPFNSYEEAQAFQQEWLNGDEIINDDGKGRIRAVDDYGDDYLVIIETDETRGSEHAPARSWAESELDVPYEKPFFDASGKRLPEDPEVTAKRDADRKALQQELETALSNATNDEEAMNAWFDDRFTPIRMDNVNLFRDKILSLRKSGGSTNEAMTIAYDENTIKRMISKLEKEIEDYKALMIEEPEDKDFWQEEMKKCQAEIDELKSYEPLKEDVLLEEPTVPFKLPKDMLNNPNSIDLKGMASKAVKDKEEAEAEAKRQAEFEANSKKYSDLIAEVKGTEGVEKQLEVLFNALVPSSGKSDTVAGELVRAIMRIMYRDYNDGDVFYEGYGLETCSGSVAYLIDTIEDSKVHNAFDNIASNQLEDDAYTNAIDKIGAIIVSYILSNKSVWQPNTEDSRSEQWEKVYDTDYRENWEPTYDYDFMIPPTIAEHIERGNCVDDEFADEVRSELENSGIEFDSVEVWSDYVYVYGLKRDDYDELERRSLYEDSSWDWFIENLNDQYGDPYEDDDDDDDDDE